MRGWQQCFRQQACVGWRIGTKERVALVPPQAEGPGVDTRESEAAAQTLQHSRTRKGMLSLTWRCARLLQLQLQLIYTTQAGGLT